MVLFKSLVLISGIQDLIIANINATYRHGCFFLESFGEFRTSLVTIEENKLTCCIHAFHNCVVPPHVFTHKGACMHCWPLQCLCVPSLSSCWMLGSPRRTHSAGKVSTSKMVRGEWTTSSPTKSRNPAALAATRPAWQITPSPAVCGAAGARHHRRTLRRPGRSTTYSTMRTTSASAGRNLRAISWRWAWTSRKTKMWVTASGSSHEVGRNSSV